MNPSIDTAAKTIWDYMHMRQPLRKCDAIFVLGSRDERVASYAAELYRRGYGEWLIISGGVAHADDMLRTSWGDKTEAEHFGVIAAGQGVPKDRLILENRATNTGQNIEYTYALLHERRIKPASLLLVQKPYMERRTYATFKKQWPDQQTEIIVSSPPIPYAEYFDEQNPKSEIMHIIVGDLQRIKEYPEIGFQIEQEIPDKVRHAYETLISAGYTRHLIDPA